MTLSYFSKGTLIILTYQGQFTVNILLYMCRVTEVQHKLFMRTQFEMCVIMTDLSCTSVPFPILKHTKIWQLYEIPVLM